ncbi:uncharacterized protein LAJ45_03545 [Morchella importuna]|uniref:uncharacterized protein n=1 Tax=Morchella importuna TaxID=1174673 RepID=UPI001E8CD8E1|nr:uncharacterized protein LAJ45_03545 [Morchella importuna]KAH8152119.1 hypothetical protein LAJ45_03545 [Morchella importuna]
MSGNATVEVESTGKGGVLFRTVRVKTGLPIRCYYLANFVDCVAAVRANPKNMRGMDATVELMTQAYDAGGVAYDAGGVADILPYRPESLGETVYIRSLMANWTAVDDILGHYSVSSLV